MNKAKLVSLDQEDQLHWLEKNSPDYLEKAYEDFIGGWVDLDEFRLSDMINSPQSYDLGWLVQEHIPETTDERAEAINEGAKLSSKELDKVKESIIEESWEGDAISCSGFYLTLESSETVYVTFTGPNEGQGGYRAEFDKIFANREDAYKFYSQKGYDFMAL